MNTTPVIYYELPKEFIKKVEDLTRKLDKDAKVFKENEVKKIANNYALVNLPSPDDRSLEPTIGQIRAFFLKSNTDIAMQLEGALQQELITMHVVHSADEAATIEKDLKKLADENKRDKVDLQSMELESDKKATKKINTMVTALGILEGIGYTLSYIKIGDSRLLGIVWGFLLGFASSWGIKLLVLYLRDRAKNLSIPVRIGIISVYTLVIIGLASLRFLSIQGSKNALVHSPIMILILIVVTLLLTGVVAGFTYLYYPNSEQEKKMQEHDALERKIMERDKQIKVLEEKLVKIKSDLNVIAQMRRRIQSITLELHKRMQAAFQESIGIFRRENLIKRGDGANPACLSLEVAPLQFKDEITIYSTSEIN